MAGQVARANLSDGSEVTDEDAVVAESPPRAAPQRGSASGLSASGSIAVAGPRLGAAGWALIALFYGAVTLVATWPAALTARTKLPAFGIDDQMQHLWVMRWYKQCLFSGRLPFLCADLQYPVGAPLGIFSPLQIQALIYLPLSLIISNDILIYNILWFSGFLFTGLGTFALSWRLTRSRAGSALAGVLAMLTAPMALHSFGHLELIYLGGFPLFLAAWIDFVDRPNAARFGLATLAYLIVAMSAAYFAVFAVFPAGLYVAWQAAGAWRRGERRWLGDRLGWLLGYAGLAGVGVCLVFSSQLWAMAHGVALIRSREEFDRFGAPLWGYLLPTWAHRLHSYLPFAPYPAALGENWRETAGERASYLGIVTLALLLYAAVRRVRFPRAGFLWAALGLLVVLSLGSACELAGYRVALPAGYLQKHFFAFRMIRVPGRFNLFAGVIAAVLAGAAFGTIVARFRSRSVRGVIFAGVTALALFDLSVTYGPTAMPARPACYEAILRRDPQASFLEIPQSPSGGSRLNSSTGYWQSVHRGRSSGGYSGHANAEFDRRLTFTSPFLVGRLADPAYLERPDAQPIDLLGTTRFRDYAWLYLSAHGFRYAVIHRWPGATEGQPAARLDRLQAQLEGAQIYEDAATVVYDRQRLPEPTEPTILCTEGWEYRQIWHGRIMCGLDPIARATVFNTDPKGELSFGIVAAGFHRAREVRVSTAGREIARWRVAAGEPQYYVSPPFRLPHGLSELVIESDGADVPRSREIPPDGDRRPSSLRITGVCLLPSPPGAPRPGQAGRDQDAPQVSEVTDRQSHLRGRAFAAYGRASSGQDQFGSQSRNEAE